MLLLASFVVVPLGLGLAVSADPRSRSMPWRLAVRLQGPAALALSASFAVTAGGLAGLLALPWLATTVLVALHGVWRLRRGPRTTPEVCLNAGLVYLAVGGAWTVICGPG